MTNVPTWLRVAPFMFYGWAVVVLVFQFVSASAILEQASTHFGMGVDAFGVFKHFVSSQVFVQAISEAAYMAANGAIVHVLIAIYDKMEGPSE